MPEDEVADASILKYNSDSERKQRAPTIIQKKDYSMSDSDDDQDLNDPPVFLALKWIEEEKQSFSPPVVKRMMSN